MRKITIILSLLLISLAATAQETKVKSYVVGFYNLENLFDTYNDPAKNDEEFLPDGRNQWTETKYQKNLHNMATVIKSLAETIATLHSLLGVS